MQGGLSGMVEPRNRRQPDAPTTDVEHTRFSDSDSSSDAESEEKETDVSISPTWVEAPGSGDGVGQVRAPFAGGGAAAPPLQRQMSTSNYTVQTKEEVEELQNMMKVIAPTPRKAKRVYNM